MNSRMSVRNFFFQLDKTSVMYFVIFTHAGILGDEQIWRGAVFLFDRRHAHQ